MLSESVFFEQTLRTTGERVSICLAAPEDIPQIVALEERVYNRLSSAEKQFILEHDAAWFDNHIRTEGNATIIVRKGDLIIARSDVYTQLGTWTEEGFAESVVSDRYDKNLLATLGGSRVRLDFAGCGLQKSMTKARLTYAAKQGRTHAASLIDVQNYRSFASLLPMGFRIEDCGPDTRDDTICHSLVGKIKDIQDKFIENVPSLTAPPMDHAHYLHYLNTDGLRDLLKSRFHGVVWRRHEHPNPFAGHIGLELAA